MFLLQLNETRKFKGYTGICTDDERYYQFRVSDGYCYMKRLKFESGSKDREQFLKLADNQSRPCSLLQTPIRVEEISMEQLNSALAELRAD
jgi:hypothetical protein